MSLLTSHTHGLPTPGGFLSVNQPQFVCVCFYVCVRTCVEGSQDLSAFPYAPIKASQQSRANVQISDVKHTHTHTRRDTWENKLKHAHMTCISYMRYICSMHTHTHTLYLTFIRSILLAWDPELSESASKRQKDTHANTNAAIGVRIWSCLQWSPWKRC